jgi:hypothetical protein
VPRASDATFAGDVRFVTRTWSIFGQPETLWIARGNKAPEKMTLLGPSPKEDDKLAIRTWASESPLGRVSARFAFRYGKTPSGGYNPVDVDLGWYSATRGKSAKVHLAKVAAFRVGRSSPSALTAVVDGGLIFLPYTGDAPLYFVSDAGKITTMPRPPADEWERYDHAVRIGDRIVLAANNFSTVVRLASTSDNGKTWSTTTWSMGEAATLVTHGGKPALVVDDHAGDAVRFVSFDALTPDPPALTLVEAKKLDDATGSLTACDAKSAGFVTDVPASASTPMINVSVSGKTDQDKLEVAYESRVMRIGDGAACVNAIVAGGGNEEVVIFSPSDMAHAWWVRAGKDDGSEARPLTCKGP